MMSKTVLMIFIVELLFTVVLMENSMADCGASNTHVCMMIKLINNK